MINVLVRNGFVATGQEEADTTHWRLMFDPPHAADGHPHDPIPDEDEDDT
jgi:hypothetical protein